MAEKINREIRLKKRSLGLPKKDNFELVEVAIPNAAQGEVLVQNIYMSVDPYMRGRMYDRESYVPSFELNMPLEGGCVGRVIASRNDRFQVGDFVLGAQGWREYFVSDGEGLIKIDAGLAPVQTYLGTLGMPGLTAYVGLLYMGKPAEGETVFVSAASGAVGSIVCQIAKLKGCRVVGSAGSDEKVSWLLQETGIDDAFNYKTVSDVIEEVGKRCPKGIDVYFENVGGVLLQAALEHINPYGRIAMCGMISMYNAVKPVAGPTNLAYIISKKLTIKGFIVSDHLDKHQQFYNDMGKWLAEGKIKWNETIVDGLENAPEAFIGLFKGKNFGKMLVRVGPDPAF